MGVESLSLQSEVNDGILYDAATLPVIREIHIDPNDDNVATVVIDGVSYDIYQTKLPNAPYYKVRKG